MYAIVEAGGKQYRVQEGHKIVVDLLDAEVGSEVVLDKVLLLNGGAALQIGAPQVNGAKVTATVAEHFRGDKIKVFKKRRRKSSHSMQGHRQDYTALTVTRITA